MHQIITAAETRTDNVSLGLRLLTHKASQPQAQRKRCLGAELWHQVGPLLLENSSDQVSCLFPKLPSFLGSRNMSRQLFTTFALLWRLLKLLGLRSTRPELRTDWLITTRGCWRRRQQLRVPSANARGGRASFVSVMLFC